MPVRVARVRGRARRGRDFVFPFPRAFPRAAALFRALRPHRRPRRVAAVFLSHEGAALEQLRARIGARLLVLQHFLGPGFAVVLRTIAEPLGIRVVVPAALVAGDAVDDLEVDVGPVDRRCRRAAARSRGEIQIESLRLSPAAERGCRCEYTPLPLRTCRRRGCRAPSPNTLDTP